MRDSIKLPRVVAMILAGGRVDELSVLTLHRPKSALPFGGTYRVIDFALSNLMHAGINQAGILSQYRPASLIDHVGVGESWDFTGLDRGARILPPYRGADASDWYKGNADAVYQNLGFLRERGAEVVMVVSGDHIYRMDYRQMIRFHIESNADLTVAFKRMGQDRRFGYGELDPDGRLTGYEEKPEHPKSDLASLTIYVFRMSVLDRVLEELSGGGNLEFGRDVIPHMIRRHRAFGYVFDGYWAYTRTVNSYYRAHQDLLDNEIDLNQWNIRTNLQDARVTEEPPPEIHLGARVANTFVSTGADVQGTVMGSVLSPGVRVRRGARVFNSIIFHGAVIEEGATVNMSIVDKVAVIGQGAQVGPIADGEPAFPSDPSRVPVTLLGKGCRVKPGSVIEPGAEINPGALI